MTKRIGKMVILEVEPKQTCELCGVIAETRPYGPNGERICYDCGMKDEKGTEERMAKILFGEKPEVNKP